MSHWRARRPSGPGVCSGLRLLDTALASCDCGQAELVGTDLGGRAVAVALDDPGLVVGALELQQRQAQLLDGGEAPYPQQVLLERPDEALDAAVALGRAHEGGRAFDAEEG